MAQSPDRHSSSDGGMSLELSPWDQVAPRNYMPVALCFPLENGGSEPADVENHVRLALDRLALRRLELGARLHLDYTSHVQLELSVSDEPDRIPLHTIHLDAPPTYDELRDTGFSANFFVNPKFTLPSTLSRDGTTVPVTQVQLLHIKGGVIVFAYMHHAFGDGSCLDSFLMAFAQETRQTPSDPSTASEFDNDLNREPCHLDLVFDGLKRNASFNGLLGKCGEYKLLPGPTGPAQPDLHPREGVPDNKRTGKIFVIDKHQLGKVRHHLEACINNDGTHGRTISTYVILAALTWAHTTRARVATAPESCTAFDTVLPTFFCPVNWEYRTKHLFADNDSVQQYFGNTVAMAVTNLDNKDELTAACDWDQGRLLSPVPDHSSKQPSTEDVGLARIAERIAEAIKNIDEEFVLTRTALLEAAPDIRRIGIFLDARVPQNFSFNTWMRIGTGARFWFPGMAKEIRPETGPTSDAIRRVQAEWALPHGLILPQCGASEDEMLLLLTLPEPAMKELEKDATWMSLVKTVVD